MKGNHFGNEFFDFDNSQDKLVVFVDMLKSRGCYIGKDGHIRSKKGNLMSYLCKNGYWLTMAQYNKKQYYFCEHRVVWCWINGSIPEGKEINHIDYNRGNNDISNLQLVTHSENIQHSKCHNLGKNAGEKSYKAKFTNKQAATIKFLCHHAGWSNKEIANYMGIKNESNVSRIKNGLRYKDVQIPNNILEIYPTLVDYTRNKDISEEEELKNYTIGLAGEVGEVSELIKKSLYHKKPFDTAEMVLELGDIMYYCVAIGNVLGIDMSEILINNNVKLLSRYKGGYSAEKSNNRIEDKHD